MQTKPIKGVHHFSTVIGLNPFFLANLHFAIFRSKFNSINHDHLHTIAHLAELGVSFIQTQDSIKVEIR